MWTGFRLRVVSYSWQTHQRKLLSLLALDSSSSFCSYYVPIRCKTWKSFQNSKEMLIVSKDFCFLKVEPSPTCHLYCSPHLSKGIFCSPLFFMLGFFCQISLIIVMFLSCCGLRLQFCRQFQGPSWANTFTKWQEEGCTGVDVEGEKLAVGRLVCSPWRNNWLPKPLSQLNHILSNISMIYLPGLFTSLDDDM